MFNFKGVKKSIISLLIVFVLLLSACNNSSNDDTGVNSNGNSTGTQAQSQIQNGSSGTSESFEEIKQNHKDDDNNGRCDECDESVLIKIDFFVINDLHGKINDSNSQPGVDELTTYLKMMYKNESNMVLLSSGDMWQGSAESNLTKGNLTTEWMNHLGFESMTVGNHEFDWGSDDIIANEKIADFPFLAINIYAKDDNQRVDYAQSSVLIERNGVKIGIIGAAGDNYSSIASDMSEDVYFKTGKDLTALVKAESEKLRKQGAQIIVYSLHDGHNKSSSGTGMIADDTLKGYYDVSLSSGGYVDIVFEAHTHQSYVLKDAYGIYHLQGGGENKGISHIEIALNAVNNNKRITESEIVSNTIYQYVEDDDIVTKLLNKYEDQLEISNKALGNNPSRKNSNEISKLVAQLYYEEGLKKWGDKYDIVLGGGQINVRNPYYIYAGEVRYSDLLSILPFDNELVLCSIKGKDLQSRFFNNDDYTIYYSSYGQSVKNNIELNKTYYIVTDSWSSPYKWNNLTEISRYGPDVYARDLLAQYILDGRLK